MIKKKRQSEKKGKRLRNLLFWAGFLICVFPIISNVVERQHQADAVATYRQTMEKEDEKEIEEKWRQANEYNEMLFQAKGGIVEETEEKKYEELLNIHGTDIMGSLEIPKIQVELPIYHGTTDEVLSNGIGHLEGTSLPIGGENTHSVLTGHRGLPSSKLLVRLDEMKNGDLFFIHTYKEVMAYKVEEIMVVKPEDTAWMEIKAEKDLVSLVTCTPFGINSHRLIVTGHRVDYKEKEYIKIKPQFPSVREIIITVFPILFVVSVGVIQIKNGIQIGVGIAMLFAVFQSFPVLAAFEQEQTGMIQMTLPEDWKINMKREGIVFGCTKIGEIENGGYKILPGYESAGIDLNNIKTSLELERVSKHLEAFGVEPEQNRQTDATGKVVFEQLDEGIYFIQAEKSNEYDLITPMIVALPSWDETEGKMSYEIKVSPKHVPIEKVGKDMAPQTGLKTGVWKWAILGIGFISAGIIVAVEWRKERKNEE